MVVLQNTNSSITREERLKINENWQAIRDAFIKVERHINILAGEDVDELIARVDSAISNSETTTASAIALINDITARMVVINDSAINVENIGFEAKASANLATQSAEQANAARDSAISSAEASRIQTNEMTTSVSAALESINLAIQDTVNIIASATQTIEDIKTQTQEAVAKSETSVQQANVAIEKMDTAIDNVDSVIQQANTAINDANSAAARADNVTSHLEGYNIPISDFVINTRFIKNQSVRFNGSTYKAKVETQGNPLPVAPDTSNAWFDLIAQRGVDGEGAVASVNGVMPDVYGNVKLPIPEPADPSWTAITEKPETFPPSSHEHAWVQVTEKPETFPPSSHEHPISHITNLQNTIDQLNESISTIGQTGIPKLVSYQYIVPATSNGQTSLTIPLTTFDQSTDTLFLYRNTTVQSTSMYSVSGQTIALTTPVGTAVDTVFHMMILKNVPIGPDGSINASVLLDGSLEASKLAPALQASLDAMVTATQAVDTRLTTHLDQKANKQQEVAQTATLLNGWIAVDWGVSFYKDNFGVVHVSGRIVGGVTSADTLLFTLPEGYKPSSVKFRNVLTYSTSENSTPCMIVVYTNGTATLTFGSDSTINLDFAFRI